MVTQTASTSIQYVEAPGPRLILELDPGITTGAGFTAPIPIRLYPNVPAKLAATAGTVERQLQTRIRQVSYEIITFDDSDRATSDFPITGGFSWTSLQLMFNPLLEPITPNFTFDSDTGEVVSDQVCNGGIWIAYEAAYHLLVYQPTVTPEFIETGAVLAFYLGAKAKLSIEIETPGLENDYAETYTVTSEKVVDETGSWEKPPGWPDANQYPGLGLGGSSLPEFDSPTIQRIHERGYVTLKGNTRRRRFTILNQRPYVGTSNYNPVYTYAQNSPPNGFEEAFLDVDFDDIKAQLQQRYRPVLLGIG